MRLPRSLVGRHRDRQARMLARLLISLDDVARERRSAVPRRRRVSLSAAR